MQVEDLLKQTGLSLTKPRKLILEFLQKNTQPLSAGDIFTKLASHLDRVTVYRNLEILEKSNLIFKELGQKENLYYLDKHQHHHISCEKCGYTQCLPCNHLFKKIQNFSQIKHQLVLTGLCNKCNK